jgi:hypothetical protein
MFPVRCACGFRAEAADSVPPPTKAAQPTQGGPGTELSKTLAMFGIHSTSGCKCKDRARQMDRNGVEWCKQHIDEIVDWMQEESRKRRLPFIRKAAEMIVKRAIRRAEGDKSIEPSTLIPLESAKWISCADLANAAVKLAGLVPPNISRVVGVPRSGMIPAGILSSLLHRPLYSLLANGEEVPVGGGSRADWGRMKDSDGVALYVDDTIHDGGTYDRLVDEGARIQEGIFVVCFAKVSERTTKRMNHWAEELPTPHLLEWNLFNAPWSTGFAIDMDGIICHNPPWQSRPLYLPRNATMPAIITARPESERQATQKWLDEFGVMYDELVMWSGAEQDRWNVEKIGAWKASQVKQLGLKLYIESEPPLADEIRKHGIQVLCPSQGKFE